MKYIKILSLVLPFLFLVGCASEPIEESKEKDKEAKTPKTMAIATIKTNQGDIKIELFVEYAPKTTANFIDLANDGFYDNTKFHRVIKGFMIQGGDPLSKDNSQKDYWGTGGPGYVFEDEIHENNQNLKGTIAMANRGPNTNGSQFFINTADNDFLNLKHTVFGKVTKGIDVIKKIEEVETEGPDRPIEDVVVSTIIIDND